MSPRNGCEDSVREQPVGQLSYSLITRHEFAAKTREQSAGHR
jgi:hypothetical protein